MNTALVIVDLQADFCSGGALPVPGADAVVPVVNELIRGFGLVFFTQDWHPRGHVSFASSHPGKRPFGRVSLPSGEYFLWPDHCVAGTPGAAFHPLLEVPAGAQVVRKGCSRDRDAYSAFFENDRTTPAGLDALLRGADVNAIVLAGLATDFCVLHTALDARLLGYDVTVIDAGCRGIDVGGSLAAAWGRMVEAGVRVA